MEIEKSGKVVRFPTISLTFERSRFDFNVYAACFREIMELLVQRRRAHTPVTLIEFDKIARDFAQAIGFPSALYTFGTHERGQILIVQPALTETNEKKNCLTNPVSYFPDASVVCGIPFRLPEDLETDRNLPREMVAVWSCILREFIYHTRPKWVVVLNKKALDLIKSVVRYSQLNIKKWEEIARGSNEKGVDMQMIKQFEMYHYDVFGQKFSFVNMMNPEYARRKATPKEMDAQDVCRRTLAPLKRPEEKRVVTFQQTKTETEEKKLKQRTHERAKKPRVQGQRNIGTMFIENDLVGKANNMQIK